MDAVETNREWSREIVTVPNLVTSLRLGLVGVLIAVAWIGRPNLYLGLLAFSLLTDFVDGLLARKLHQVSLFGAHLDSVSDLLTCLSIPLCAWWLWPGIILRELPLIVIGLGSYLVAMALGLAKFGRLASHHTWGAKFAAASMGVSVIILLAGWSPWPFRVLIPFVVLEAMEEIAMVIMLPRWRPNVPSVWHAWRIRQAERQALAAGSQSGPSARESMPC